MKNDDDDEDEQKSQDLVNDDGWDCNPMAHAKTQLYGA